MQRNPITLLTRGASAAVLGALLAGGPRTVVTTAAKATRASGSSPRGPRLRRAAPSLKRPRTPHDFAMIARAEAKRARKAEKRRRDFEHTAAGVALARQFIVMNAKATRRDAQIRAEALSIARELDAGAAA
jgi:hypothetical protein